MKRDQLPLELTEWGQEEHSCGMARNLNNAGDLQAKGNLVSRRLRLPHLAKKLQFSEAL
jgi:hypothetical protein